ncbi:Rha family transcriptional regulator [Xylanibacter ruminicola]|uniref:Rha family transcriptional regulator n=1 Tax=Xylanibacter ruminicola TaxID=839 RepID=UPI0009B9011A|nr:Rha family transcriptional regulator [Xylanibacter ruminicola]
MTQIININTVQTITSLEIAELTGKQHKNLMRDIRKMEIAWEKICGLKFELTSRTIVQPNGGTREVPCYQLTKTECLYIATKFNDEQRAKLVLRWEELELERLERLPALQVQKKILALADGIIGEGLRLLNEPAEDTLTATQVAKTFNMTTFDFNAILRDMGIQYRRDGHWNISDDLADRNLTRLRTHVSYSLKGVKKIKTYMTWTLDGVRFLNSKLGYPNF